MRRYELATAILINPGLSPGWLLHLREMRSRIENKRKVLYEELFCLGTNRKWEIIVSQARHFMHDMVQLRVVSHTDYCLMFLYIGLSSEQVAIVQADIHVYIQRLGRISVAGYKLSRTQRLVVLSHACLFGE